MIPATSSISASVHSGTRVSSASTMAPYEASQAVGDEVAKLSLSTATEREGGRREGGR